MQLKFVPIFALSALLFAFGCSDDGVTVTPCSTAADCPTGEVCTLGFCASSTSGRGGRDTGTTADGGNPGLDIGTGSDVPSLDTPVTEDVAECVPDCSGRECGDDGCGGSCGFCGGGDTCVAGICQGGGGGGDDCPGVIECINASDGSQAALEGCIGGGTAEAQGQIVAILECIQTNCADPDMSEEEFGQCQQDFCSTEINECFGIGTGSATCPEVIECLLGCADQDCANACVGTGSAGAQAAAVDYFNCAVESCAEVTTPEEFYSCAEASCPTEAAECAGS